MFELVPSANSFRVSFEPHRVVHHRIVLHFVGLVACIGLGGRVCQMHAAGDGGAEVGAVMVGPGGLRCDVGERCIVQDCRMRVRMVVVMAELTVL